MWGRVFAGFLFLVVVAFFISAGAGETVSGPEGPVSGGVDAVVSQAVSVSQVLPDCVIDLDCGLPGESGFVCWKGFVAREFVTPKCVGAGSRQARCVNDSGRDVLDWCRPDEECVTGRGVCQPRDSSTYKPTGRLVNNLGSGGSSDTNLTECTSNETCGLESWSPPYCGKDGSVYRNLLTYECVNAGIYGSYCQRHKSISLLDYCGPLNQCRDGICYDDQDRLPYAYYDGGYFGSKRTRLTEEYACGDGEVCATDTEEMFICRGSSCYNVTRISNDQRVRAVLN